MFKGMAWSAVERISIQVVQFIVQIALARILTPSEYGIIGILYVFIVISGVFIDSGFTKALIQKKNRTDNDISTVFFFNIGISIIAYLVLFFVAPLAATLYNIDELTILLRVLSISLIINSLYAVPIILYTIKLDFKALTKINLIAAILSGMIAYYMALNEWGVWSLVGLAISRSIITGILTTLMNDWKPNGVFSKKSLKELFSFGSNLLISSLLNAVVNKVYELVIPKTSSIQDLGYYTRGTQFTDTIFGFVNSVYERILLPGLTEVQDQIELLVNHTRSLIRAAALFIIPIFLLLVVVAKPLIIVLLTEKWLPAVPIMQIFCFARLITIISGVNVNLLYVIGRTDLALKQQYLKLGIRVIFLIAALKFGIIYIAIAELISTAIHFFINTYYPGKIMSYGAFSQLKDIGKILFSGVVMSLAVFFIISFLENNIIKLLITPIIALPIYFGLIKMYQVKELNMIISKMKAILNKQM